LPLVGPTIRLTIYLSILGSLQQFVIIWIMTEGGPVGHTEVLGTFLYKYGIDGLRLGFGSAIAVVIFCMSLVFSIGYQWMVLRQDYRSLQAQ
ncbi:MAG: sugar ABC transporter permease, partial [Phototrophicales bacterium]